MPVKVPAGSTKAPQMGIGGENVPKPATPPVPGHYGGSKVTKYGK